MMMSITSTFAQKKMAACCAPVAATDQFAMLANDKKFMMSHDAPLPFVYHSANGTDITFKTADGTDAHGMDGESTKANQLLFICDT